MGVGHLVGEELHDPSFCAKFTLNVKIDVLVSVVTHPRKGQRGPDTDDKELESKHGVQQFVHKSHQVANFGGCFLLVHHDLGMVADVKADTVAVRSVFQSASSEQKVLGTARLWLSK